MRTYLFGLFVVLLLSPGSFAVGQSEPPANEPSKPLTNTPAAESLSTGDVSIRIGTLNLSLGGPLPPPAQVQQNRSVAVPPAMSTEGERLLLRGLEAQLLSDDSTQAAVLMSQAYALSPNNPAVAFWHTRAQLENGFGTQAKQLLEKHRDSITTAYPGWVAQLEIDIARRVELEGLPAGLVARIDKTEQPPQPSNSYKTCFAYFRMVDQNDEPIDTNQVRVQSSGGSAAVETFDDGYALLTCKTRSTQSSVECKLSTRSDRLRQQEVSFTIDPATVSNAGVFKLYRYSDKDRQKVVAEVRDSKGKPVSGAKLMVGGANIDRNTQPITNSDGQAELSLLPGQYSVHATATGYASSNSTLRVVENAAKPHKVSLTVRQLLTARVKLVWRAYSVDLGNPDSNNIDQDESFFAGTTTLTFGSRPNQSSIGWAQIRQVGDKMQLQFPSNSRVNSRIPQREPVWVGELTSGEAAQQNHADRPSLFASVDLEKMAEVRKQAKDASLSPQANANSLAYSVDEGDIYAGQIYGRDMRTGRYALYKFKAFVEKLSGVTP